MRFLFIVQGEGRGHLTQTITLFEMLQEAGHTVCAVMVGKSERRVIPEFFKQRIKAPIHLMASPNFVTDKNNKSVKLLTTIAYNARFSPRFFASLSFIDEKVKEHQPDVIINFYDFLGGLYSLLYRPKAHYVCVGHQYLAEHPQFEFSKGKPLDKWLFKFNNKLTSFGADLKLSLSFSEYTPLRYKKNVVAPPLLRKEVFNLQPESEDFILAYMVNSGYGQEVMDWSDQNPGTKIHCFWDEKSKPEVYQHNADLTFHQVNDKKFLDLMGKCKGYVSTAGFESICEAMYLQKPVLMIPVAGQYEQECNALDAKKAGAGISASSYKIDELLRFISEGKHQGSSHNEWLKSAKSVFLKELEVLKPIAYSEVAEKGVLKPGFQ